MYNARYVGWLYIYLTAIIPTHTGNVGVQQWVHKEIVFACENNIYGMGTSDVRAVTCTDYYTIGETTSLAYEFAISHRAEVCPHRLL